MNLRISRPWLRWAAILGLVGLVGKELVLELVFGSAADWLKSNLWVIGDFLAWRWSGLALGVILLVGVWGLGTVVERKQAASGTNQPDFKKELKARGIPRAASVTGVVGPGVREISPAKEPQAAVAEPREDPNHIEHDGVFWQWTGGMYVSGGLALRGPFCPRDYMELDYYAWIDALKGEGIRRTLHSDDRMGDGNLYCLECKEHRSLGLNKSVKESRREAEQRFEARHRRPG